MRKNGFAPIVIILVVAVLGIVGYFGYDKLIKLKLINNLEVVTKSTADWKTFTSNLYGFNIQYPPTVNPPEESAINETVNPPASGYMEFSLPENQDSLSIKVWANPSKLSVRDWINKVKQDEANKVKSGSRPPVVPTISEVDTTINGAVAYQSVSFGGEGDMKSTYFSKDKYIIEVSFWNANLNIQDQEKSKAIFERMLSSFKFTK